LGWILIGCKRGSIKKHMAPIEMCPYLTRTRSAFDFDIYSMNESVADKDYFTPETVNALTKENIQLRQLALGRAAPRITNQNVDIDALLQDEETSWPALQGLRKSQSNQPILPRLSPLDDCIMSIIWELHDIPALGIVSDCDGTNFLVLLRSAAFYQAKTENVSAT